MTATPLKLAGYPSPERVVQGVSVWGLGHDGDISAVVAAGHGPLTQAALVEHMAAEHDSDQALAAEEAASPEATTWAVFEESCGCSDARHAMHAATARMEGVSTGEVCDEHDGCSSGLPPCGDEYAFLVRRGTADLPGAVAVTWATL